MDLGLRTGDRREVPTQRRESSLMFRLDPVGHRPDRERIGSPGRRGDARRQMALGCRPPRPWPNLQARFDYAGSLSRRAVDQGGAAPTGNSPVHVAARSLMRPLPLNFG